MRPRCLREDDTIYIDDDDVTVMKTEECQFRKVFLKSTRPHPGPIETVVLTDSDSDSDTDTAFFAERKRPIRGKYA